MKKILCSKKSKGLLWFAIISTFLICTYIFLFVGTGTTHIDNVCTFICLTSMGMMFIRDFLIEYQTFNENN